MCRVLESPVLSSKHVHFRSPRLLRTFCPEHREKQDLLHNETYHICQKSSFMTLVYFLLHVFVFCGREDVNVVMSVAKRGSLVPYRCASS
jgi:hypothetical protein